MPNTPFDLNDQDAYHAWRDAKLTRHPRSAEELIVEVRDPRDLSAAELDAVHERVGRCNMAIYVTTGPERTGKDLPRRLGAQLGLRTLDHNMGADDDAITSLQVRDDEPRSGYIPYTDRPISWHTDGYYNPPERRILALLLHCARPAAEGGENAVLDHEIAYIRLRDQNPEHIRALMGPQAMSIPPNKVAGEEIRPIETGPVFSVIDGHLHMRYTDRKRNIVWHDDAATTAAVQALKDVLHAPDPLSFNVRLESGWGLVANNTLHTRTGFSDTGDSTRLLYRGRYFERIRQ